jgi:hypothetical protein
MREPDPTPTYKKLIVYGDESGVTGAKYQAYGSLWMPWERRGDFMRVLREVREAHGYEGGVALSASKAEGEGFALSLIDEVFRRRWLAFRCVITPATDSDELRRLAFSALIRRRLRTIGDLDKRELRLRLTKASRARDANGETTERAVHRLIGLEVDGKMERSTRPARSGAALEIVELLTSLVASDWEKKATSPQRRHLSDRAAENLGWSDLTADTDPSEWKFNIWYLEDPRTERPVERTHRTVQLRLPLVD